MKGKRKLFCCCVSENELNNTLQHINIIDYKISSGWLCNVISGEGTNMIWQISLLYLVKEQI